MAYNSFVFSIQEWLRRRVKRGSPLWVVLIRIKRALQSVQFSMKQKKWKANEKQFNTRVNQYAQWANDFFFIQIGAHDGKMGDPLHGWIREYSWNGIFVEPQKEQFEKLLLSYKTVNRLQNLIFENVAISDTNGTRILYKVHPDYVRSNQQTGLASFYPDKALSTYAVDSKVTSEEVQCITMATLLERNNVKKIDLLQIDTEGFDYEIIKMIDFDKIKPALIHFEHKHLSSNLYRECIKLLESKGYEILEKRADTAAIFHSGLLGALAA